MDQEETESENTEIEESHKLEEITEESEEQNAGDTKNENDDMQIAKNVEDNTETQENETQEEQQQLQSELEDEPTENKLEDTQEETEEPVSDNEDLEDDDNQEETLKEEFKDIPEQAEEELDSQEEEEEGEEATHKGGETNEETRESLVTKKESAMSYEMGPRIRDTSESQVFGADFLLNEEEPMKFYKFMDEKEEECQEESVEEEQEIAIDRTPYYEKYDKIMRETTVETIKNNILQKKLAKFFKRRKMEHALKETNTQFDTKEKYGKKLDAFGELTDLDVLQRTTMTNELESLKKERDVKLRELNTVFENLQAREKDTGYGLIHTKTGNPIPDKLVERLVQRQKTQMQTIGDMRLKFIQLKNIVAEKQTAISNLDRIGENLYLMDYEQLKVENRSFMDKIEEKDEELSRLRNKCQKTIQILAHMREKSAALETDIIDLTDDLAMLNINSTEARGELNRLKQQRDYFRNMTTKLREESGLLTESELLRDMEVSIQDLKLMTQELELLKEEHKIKAQQIRNIRKNIEYTPDILMKKTNRLESNKTTCSRRIYKGRPSLHDPILPKDAFKHLTNFRGKPTFDKRVKKWKV